MCSVCFFQFMESLNLVLVVGLAVDYVVHLAEGYSRSAHRTRHGRLRDALEEVGISVLSGAITTLGASMFLLIAEILFFKQFGVFMFSTIGLSIVYALGLFIVSLAIFGPENDTGDLKVLFSKCFRKCSKKNTVAEPNEDNPSVQMQQQQAQNSSPQHAPNGNYNQNNSHVITPSSPPEDRVISVQSGEPVVISFSSQGVAVPQSNRNSHVMPSVSQ